MRTSRVEVGEAESISTAVVDLVAKHRGVEPLDLEPLYGAVDPDALDSIFSSIESGTRDGALEFRYEGAVVNAVVEDGQVTLTAEDETSDHEVVDTLR